MSTTAKEIYPSHKFITHRRTITETDIVNLTALHKSSSGFTILDLMHVTKNQRGEKVVEFTETVLFHKAESI